MNAETSAGSSQTIDRRTFVKTLSAAGLGLALGTSQVSAQTTTPARKRRYALVGTGDRSEMYRTAIVTDYRDSSELVGLCDVNPGRVELARQEAAAKGAAMPAGFVAADFDRMIRETRPDYVIVTTVDSTHDDYIVRAMEAGCDVITEKPMTNRAEKCQRIYDAKKRTGRNIRVTFNYRYSPARTQVKDLLMSGEIGDILSVDFHWLLNTHHGADYFRRWHGLKQFSNGLMLHKATHHFDLVNWWLGAMPVTVLGSGKREFYTPTMAKRLGLASHHERCRTCPEKEKCNFFLDLAANTRFKALYLDQEHHDNYFRDKCVFRPEIDIEDTMNVIVNYDTGTTLSYSLNAFNAWEGYMIAFNGTKGRLEHGMVEATYVNGEGSGPAGILEGQTTTRIIPLRGSARTIEPWTGTGGHAGGDKVMLDDIFLAQPPADKYLRASDEHAGAASILIGIAANRSFETGQSVKIADLVSGMQRPRYAPMPTHNQAVPMPPRATTRPA